MSFNLIGFRNWLEFSSGMVHARTCVREYEKNWFTDWVYTLRTHTPVLLSPDSSGFYQLWSPNAQTLWANKHRIRKYTHMHTIISSMTQFLSHHAYWLVSSFRKKLRLHFSLMTTAIPAKETMFVCSYLMVLAFVLTFSITNWSRFVFDAEWFTMCTKIHGKNMKSTRAVTKTKILSKHNARS